MTTELFLSCFFSSTHLSKGSLGSSSVKVLNCVSFLSLKVIRIIITIMMMSLLSLKVNN